MDVGKKGTGMGKKAGSLSPAQLEIMNLFWDHGELSVAQIWRLLGGRRPIARNTVQTMLTRLTARGWLHARAEGKAFVFRAARPRKAAMRGILGQLVETAFAGSAGDLIMTLLETRRISADEAVRIRQLIERAEQQS
jgi:BlaI family transcriptional regulator, penicillinase repressor